MGIQKAKHNLENNIKYIWHEVRKTFTPVFRYKREILRQMILFQPILSVHGHTLISTHLPHIIEVIECWLVHSVDQVTSHWKGTWALNGLSQLEYGPEIEFFFVVNTVHASIIASLLEV